MSREVIPVAALLFLLLILSTGYIQQSGMHLQDDMYTAGTDSPQAAAILAGDPRFVVWLSPDEALLHSADPDVLITGGALSVGGTQRGAAAANALRTDYATYLTSVYNQEEDLFAAYPLWIDLQYVESELDFAATQEGQRVGSIPQRGTSPVPDHPVEEVAPPSADLSVSEEELRAALVAAEGQDSAVARYTDTLSAGPDLGEYATPSQITPPLPFDAIILIFVFIFPLYFTSQFFMMSIMNERIERRGEILLSTPLPPWAIIAGKMLPYLLMMLGITVVLSFYTGATVAVIVALVPVILFFLANALLIGMTARSFKELSFISIFFSTIATSYLFFPSIFAHIHVISLISPLTLVIYDLEGVGFTMGDYVYSTFLFWTTSAVIFAICIVNFREERLFSLHPLKVKMREYIAALIPETHPFAALFGLTICTIPFVLMAQMMGLVLLFNLPMPLSLVLLVIVAAFIEEWAKSLGIYAVYCRRPSFLSWRNLVLCCLAVMAGFFVGEKLLLFATLAQISESLFGAALFSSLHVLWLPLTLHFAGAFVVTVILKVAGPRSYPAALLGGTAVHSIYNLTILTGGL